MTSTSGSTRPEQVVLLGYPVQLGLSVAEHVEGWMREFALIAIGQEAGTATRDVPERLQSMVQHLTRTYATELSGPDQARAAAAERGDETVDLVYPVRPETEATVLAWQQMVREVDEYCRARDLLMLERTPEQVALNDWVCEEFVRQLAGQPPRPWPARGEPAG